MFSAKLFSAAALFFFGVSSVVAAPLPHSESNIIKTGDIKVDVTGTDRRDVVPATPSVQHSVAMVLADVYGKMEPINAKCEQVMSFTNFDVNELKPLLKEYTLVIHAGVTNLKMLKEGKLPEIDVGAATAVLDAIHVGVEVTDQDVARILSLVITLLGVFLKPVLSVVHKIPEIQEAVLEVVSNLGFIVELVKALLPGVFNFLAQFLGITKELADSMGLTALLS
ncbi:hypothetical protein FRC03_006134 [Tulasnella sp. 419]|nr:hypothetical protein FRC03_006134 [Tulasnella sp. 419]